MDFVMCDASFQLQVVEIEEEVEVFQCNYNSFINIHIEK